MTRAFVRRVRAVLAPSALAALALAAPGFPAAVARAAAAELVVWPSEARVRPGEAQPFAALLDAGRVANGASWRVIPASLGTIGPDGVFRAGSAPGRGLVRVQAQSESGLLVGHAIVLVGRDAGPSHLRVVPETVALLSGRQASFRAVLPNGDSPRAPIAWSVSPETAGVIEPDGQFRAGSSPGRARILATIESPEETMEGAALVWVGRTGGPQPTLGIRPESASLASGASTRFEALLAPPSDSLLARIRWALFPEALGRIGSDGTLDADREPGEGHVVASLDWEGRTIRAFARVRILPRLGAVVLRVTPDAALLAPGRSLRFDVALIEGDSAALEPRAPADVRWSVSPPGLGSMSVDGTLTAFAADGYPDGFPRGEVVAQTTLEGAAVEGRAAVGIEPAASADLDVTPRVITTEAGREVRLTASLGGEPIPSQIPVDWSVFPTTLGAIGAGGLFTANEILDTAGIDESGRREGAIVGRALLPEGKAVRGAARVVVLPAPARSEVNVEPHEAIVDFATGASAEPVTFRVLATPSRGDGSAARVGSAPRVEWLVRPAAIGTISRDGVFTANARFALGAALDGLGQVEGRVVADVSVSTRETIRGEARIVLRLPPPSRIVITIEPPKAALPAGATLRFVGRVAGRNVADLPVAVVWSVTPPELGQLAADGFFAPNPEPPPGGKTRAGQVRLAVTPRVGAARIAAAAITVTY